MRLEDGNEGEAIRSIGLPVVEYLERRRTYDVGTFVFTGQGETTRSSASRTIGRIPHSPM
jgi:hypothetical protein